MAELGGGELRTLAVDDLESDGQLEIIVGRASGGATKQLSVYEPNGTVRSGCPARRDGTPGYGWGMYNQNVAVADMNGDGRPDLLIADEPTTALDVTVQAEVLELLRELQKELNMGVILVTHNFGVVADLCDRVSVMRHGRIVETGPVRPLFAHPEHEYTQQLFDAILEDTPPRGPLVATQKGAGR